MRRPRALLADDHRLVVEALRGILEPQYEVAGTVTDGRSLLKAAEKLRPDIIVLDIAMPQLNGLEAARKLKHEMPGVKLIFLTMNEDPYLVGEAFRAGASAFLLKRSAALELTEAIECVLKGEKYVTQCAAEGQTNISLRAPGVREHAPEPSAREREVIQLLVKGRTMKEVARALKITARTVAAHKYHAMELLQLKTDADLVQYAIKHGIISV